MNRVGADLVLGVLHRDRFGHQPYRRLRGVVGHVNVLAADDAGNRRQIDDRSAAISDHCRDRVFDAEEHAGRVDRNNPVPGFGAVKSCSALPEMPALLTSTSSLPKCRVVVATTAAQLSSLVTSSGSNRAEAPMASATCRPSCSSTSPITTLAPSRANMRAVAAL